MGSRLGRGSTKQSLAAVAGWAGLIVLLTACTAKFGSAEWSIWPGFNFEASLAPPSLCFGCLDTGPLPEIEEEEEPDVVAP